ncbi:MAG: SDR family oxidoreductase [Rhizorhabdus sp.]|jgi:2-hydroxycyclohexanecarboxyl-CoA dehydrogenase|uniref:SDR family NAD(P)-dependent oxidoreductase n=1 Tax=Rhizorhabdus sp. TaxID=1968843 RepID=UPI001B541E48|nr:SDR family NAD(P)-dependent oxidoreductase [Rhizorhabdus sp.]MBP8232150.1 SDR family oxidoreductase [Rhizorhabdus sp.]
MGRLTGKIAIVTGGGSGIGREICRQFVDEGCAALAIFDIDEAGAQETIAQIDNGQAKIVAYKVDVGDLATVDAAVTAFHAAAGDSPDILVNNVGWDQAYWFLESQPDFWDKLIHVNFKGVLNTCWTVLKLMVAAKRGGRIINVASDAGRLGAAHEAVYSGCKGGVITFTKALAREHSRDNILCNVVSPGATRTAGYDNVKYSRPDPERFDEKNERQIPLRRIGEPGEVAAMITFLASDDASYVQGQIISVSGGLTMVG